MNSSNPLNPFRTFSRITMLIVWAVVLGTGNLSPAAPGDERWDTPFGIPGVQEADGSPGDVYVVAASGDDVYVGGSFSMAGGKPMSSQGETWGNIARWNQTAQK